MRRSLAIWIPVALTASLLVAAEVLTQRQSYAAEAEPYFAEARQAAEAIPYALPGGYIGEDVPVPTRAVDMLKPNLLVSRQYQSIVSPSAVSLLVVQTRDVADLLAHYPPACYPGQGWSIAGSEARDFEPGGLPIQSTIYEMIPPGGDAERPVYIYNFMVQADGQTSRDMVGLNAFARRGKGRTFGGGQVQVLFFGDADVEQRDATFATVVEAIRPTVEAILDGYDG